jgi:hypothetical protein
VGGRWRVHGWLVCCWRRRSRRGECDFMIHDLCWGEEARMFVDGNAAVSLHSSHHAAVSLRSFTAPQFYSSLPTVYGLMTK